MKKFLYACFIQLVLMISFLVASENNPTEEEVSKLYVATFNRAPDSVGLEYWTKTSNLTLSQIAQSFFDQEETQLLYPSSVSNTEFISSVYQNFFNREPDNEGLNYWEDELNSEVYSKNLFIQTIINGAKDSDTFMDATILNNKNEVGLYFAKEGYSDSVLASTVMSGVTESSLSVSYIKEKIANDEIDTNVWDDYAQTSLMSYKVVDTKQSTCYNSSSGVATTCTGVGYDADYIGNTPDYSVSNGIVTDNVTGLMWTQSTDLNGNGETSDAEDKLSQNEAAFYCSDLSLGGYDDWRLPDIKTLYSLIVFDGEDPSGYSGTDTSSLKTFLDESFSRSFGDSTSGERIIDGQYATTTNYVSTTMNGQTTMFGVNFVDGRIKGYPTTNKEFYVLCVRGNEDYGKNSFIDNGDETITDIATNLMWEQNDVKSTDFENAISTCEGSSTAGYSDWRLPNVKELQSIVDYTSSPDTSNHAAIDPLFNSTPFINENGENDWGYYWSSTTHASMQGGQAGAYVSFGRALGYMNGTVLDVHGAGAQRSNDKMSYNNHLNTATDSYGNTFYYFGPQGDIARIENMVRCVRDNDNSLVEYKINEKEVTITETGNDSGLIFTSNLVSDGSILFSTMGDNQTQLIDNDANIVNTWTSTYPSANALYLTDEQNLIRGGKIIDNDNPFTNGGGAGGIIEEFDYDGNLVWDFTYSSDTYTLHHDFKDLGDGSILALSWELRNYNDSIYWDEKILHVNKYTKEIIWSWSAMDNGILPTSTKSDYLHMNSIDYKNGTILVSARNLNQLILIDKESGKILKQYSGNLNGQHDASFLDNGNILVFNNGISDSMIQEISQTSWSVEWEYNGDFFSERISGVQRLSNGNTLICSGVEGTFIEVTSDGKEVWKYINPFTKTTPHGDKNEVFKIRKY